MVSLLNEVLIFFQASLIPVNWIKKNLEDHSFTEKFFSPFKSDFIHEHHLTVIDVVFLMDEWK